MLSVFQETIENNRQSVFQWLHQLEQREEHFLLQTDIHDEFSQYTQTESGRVLGEGPFARLIELSQEIMRSSPWLYFSIRPKVGQWLYFRIHTETLYLESVDISDYLKAKERIVRPSQGEDDWVLEVDLKPFNRDFPTLRETRNIGRGVEFLNRYLSNHFFNEGKTGHRTLLHFLKVHQFKGQQLMINDRISSIQELEEALDRARELLERKPSDQELPEFTLELQQLGFEPGWGRTAQRVRETMQILVSLLEAPDAENVTEFLSRIPMIFNIVILSPHGYFGQSGVLGKPDTGGQVVYILDQVKALEREVRERLYEQGLDLEPRIVVVTRLIPEAGDTTCNERLEPIIGTKQAVILRVPFRNEDGGMIPHWISRFHIWPYLERFSIEAEKEILALLGNRPDFIIGNYSDGNLVATLLSQRMKVTQCTIAHALEKSKYLFSDLYWNDLESQYRFSCQFTADLIAMNTADFIITSTYQEIAGNSISVGQYETYSNFTMPGLYRVVNGVNVLDPKFNIVSPGADEDIFFPYTDSERRLFDTQNELHDLIYGEPNEQCRGHLDDPEKPLLFTMARMDRIKNLTGLVRMYAQSERLRSLTRLVVIGGYVNPDRSGDEEEREQIYTMHSLFDEYGLDSDVRWVGRHLQKAVSGELYRYIADRRGAFVQPALFEAFGLTVIEAMSTGLPTFATLFGGPLEIIEDGVSGYHIDPNRGEAATECMADFFERCNEDPTTWDRISQGSIHRVESLYNWRRYSQRLMSLARIYGFWKFVTNLEREETVRYLQLLYSSVYKPRANA